jgi:heme/copper-type cytochrome/quinol oxidase subunit 2
MRYRTLHYYNDFVAGIFGYASTILLIVLIKFRSTNELKQYSRMLLMNCLIDLLFNTNTFIVVLVGCWQGYNKTEL